MKPSFTKRALVIFSATFLQAAAVTFGAVTINNPPAALTTVTDGDKITLTVNATGGNALNYTWWKRAVPPAMTDTIVKGESSSNQFVIASAKVTDAGSYYVRVKETQTNLTADSAPDSVVIVNVRPKITVQPKAPATAAGEGTNVTFNVTIDNLGTAPFTYTWQKKNGTSYDDIITTSKPDRTDTFTLTGVQLASAGSYRVRISNASSVVANSADVVLKVNSRPGIITNPAPNFNVVFGATGSLRVVVGGNAPFTYRWLKNGVVIPKSNSATLTIKGTDNMSNGVAEGPGTYKVQVVNIYSPGYPLDPKATDPFTVATITESADSTVRVIRRPRILAQPQNASIDITGALPVNHTMSVGMDTTGDEGTLEYQWFKDGRAILGATAASLSFTPVTWADRGSYRVVITTRSGPGAGFPVIGTVTSASAVLTIISPPIITSQSPVELYGATKGSVKLFVVATGTTPLTYEWRYRPVGAAAFSTINGARAATLTLSNLSNANHQGDYECIVRNAPKAPALPGSATSTAIYVQADDVPKITQQTTVLPYDGTITKGTPKIPATKKLHLQVKLTGTNRAADEAPPGTLKANPFVVRWLKNGQPFLPAPGATTTSTSALGVTTLELIIDPAAGSDTGKYSCEVANKIVKVVSTALAITVSGPPFITGQPPAVTGIQESKIETTVTATGGSPTLTYQWQKDLGAVGSPNFQNVPGKTAAKLIFATAQLSDDGIYRCRVTNAFGSTDSDPVIVKVDPIPSPTIGPVANVSALEFHPFFARAGEKVRIYGSNLRYVKTVKLAGLSCAPVTIESDSSILVTVPAGTSLLENVPFEVSSVNPTPTFTTATFTRSNVYANVGDFIITPVSSYYYGDVNARILDGTSVVADGDTTGSGIIYPMTRISTATGANTNLYSPAFYSWRVKTNSMIGINVQSSTIFDCALRVFIENPLGIFLGPDRVTRFSLLGASNQLSVTYESVPSFFLGANKQVIIVVESSNPYDGFMDPWGIFRLRCVATPTTRTSSDIPSASSTSDKSKKTDSTSGEITSTFDGSLAVAADPVEVWSSGSSSKAIADGVISFDMSLKNQEAGGDDQFSWQFNDTDGNGAGALWFNPADSSIRYVSSTGNVVSPAARISATGASCHFECVFDATADSITIFMDGAVLIPSQKLPTGTRIGSVSATWDLGADAESNGSSVFFEQFRVETSVAP